ncbi:MAG: SIR2 family NAD-dependent protein deacylase [Candidatus Jordarchaeum sp.]|uniref:SIR2 family NAD-dependent protein deacylase n=1 Tax=Candidatus Jordarchaeum sp. TaxID=2823881 RepID=UPI00404A41B8
MPSEEILGVARLIKGAKKVVVLTGAGISVESGIPDFRGPDGLWKRYSPDKVGTITSFLSNPEEWWKMAQEIAPVLFNAQPNLGHFALAELEKMGKVEAIITQNIDGLHQKAGSKKVVEVHGNVRSASCVECRKKHSIEYVISEVGKGNYMPQCTDCGGVVKVDVVMFGEMLPEEAISEAYRLAQECDLLLVVGSSLVVYPVAALPGMALNRGAKTVIINMEKTGYTKYANYHIYGKAGEVLPQIVEALKIL